MSFFNVNNLNRELHLSLFERYYEPTPENEFLGAYSPGILYCYDLKKETEVKEYCKLDNKDFIRSDNEGEGFFMIGRVVDVAFLGHMAALVVRHVRDDHICVGEKLFLWFNMKNSSSDHPFFLSSCVYDFCMESINNIKYLVGREVDMEVLNVKSGDYVVQIIENIAFCHTDPKVHPLAEEDPAEYCRIPSPVNQLFK